MTDLGLKQRTFFFCYTRVFRSNAQYQLTTQSQFCLSFSWIEFQMLLRSCLIQITVIILRHILCVAYLSKCLGLGLFVIFSLFFNVIYNIPSFKQMHLFLYIFYNISYYFLMITWMKKANNFQIAKIQPQGVA